MLPYLFGSILTVTPGDVWLVVGLGAVIVVTIALVGRALFAIVVDEESARVAGIPVDACNAMLVGAHRGHDRRRDPGRRHAARRRAHGAPGRDRAVVDPLVPRDGGWRPSRSASCRWSVGSPRPASGVSPRAARSSSRQPCCSASPRSSPAAAVWSRARSVARPNRRGRRRGTGSPRVRRPDGSRNGCGSGRGPRRRCSPRTRRPRPVARVAARPS